MQQLIESGRIADVILAIIMLELVGLLVLRHMLKRGPKLLAILIGALAIHVLANLLTRRVVAFLAGKESDGRKKDRERRGSDAVPAWDGSGQQLLLWHYEKSLGRYFNNPVEIKPLVSGMGVAFYVVLFGIIAAMLVLLYGALRGRGPLYWLLAAVPALLPVFFIIDYSAWLWWYGHRLNDMGAFTVKPFMPTVFGDGKVAQFSTHSYPYWGFGMMLVLSVVIAVMVILRRKQANRASVT